MRYETLRKSAFFNTYGPGAIYETVNGKTVVIKKFIADTEILLKDKFLNSFIRNYVGKGKIEGESAVFLIKDYDENGEPAFSVEARPFFEWFIGRKKDGQDPTIYLFHKRKKNDYEMLSTVRFIGICKNGHMQDLDWNKIVHRGKRCGNKDVFVWSEKKGDVFGGLEIRCPVCGKVAGLKEIYNTSQSCRGILAHTHNNEEEGCDKNISVTLKTASDVYLPESLIFISAHPFASPKYRIFIEKEKLLGAVSALKEVRDSLTKEQIVKVIRNHISEEELNILFGIELEGGGFVDQIFQIVEEVETYLSKHEDVTEEGVKRLEFQTFRKACDEGYPAIRDDSGDFYLKIDKNKRKDYKGFIIQPVEKLTFYRVFIGYRRTSPDPSVARLIPVYDFRNGKYYFAGIKNVTEGIFITLTDSILEDLRRHYLPEEIFAFIHTLSHGIIKYFSQISGYSEASLRERIYFFGEDSRVSTGILVFALSEGGDGAAGGLTSSVLRDANVEAMFNYVIDSAVFCSRDPVCWDSTEDFGSSNWKQRIFNRNEAVCHSCLLVSETSCEYANKGLSRKKLKEIIEKLI